VTAGTAAVPTGASGGTAAAVVVLAEHGDRGAAAVARCLGGRASGGRGPRVVRVSPGELARAGWSHRVGRDGRAETRIVLPGGRVLDGVSVAAVLNRLPWLPPGRLGPGASAKDRDYAASELRALVASWLLSLGGRVLGSAGPHGTAVGPLSGTAVLVHAERCGLPVARRGGATRTGLLDAVGPGERAVPVLEWPGGRAAPVPVELRPAERPGAGGALLVAGGRVSGSGAVRWTEACLRLAGVLGVSLFELRLSGGLVAAFDPLPPLDGAGQAAEVAGALLAAAGGPPVRRDGGLS
jgi:hypothetical protein